MAESVLSIQLSDLAQAVAHSFGFGRTTTAWDGWQAATPYVASGPDTRLSWIMECVQAGYRRFLHPKPSDDGPAYEWSFLTPQRQINVIAAQATYDLPDEFQRFVGDLTFQPSDNAWSSVRRTGIGEVKRKLAQNPGLQTFPSLFATAPKATDGSQGQRDQIVFFPIPDKAYTFDSLMNILPGPLTAAAPYPYGGMEHGETIIAACLAVKEQRFDNIPNGPNKMDFEENLRRSIALDREHRPEFFGQNLDRSDDRDVANYMPWGNVLGPVLHNGLPW